MGHHEGQHDESLIDKVKNALGFGNDDETDADRTGYADDRAGSRDTIDVEGDDRPDDGWAGVPGTLYDDTSSAGADGAADEPGLGRNPGPVGSAQYEGTTSYDELGDRGTGASGGYDRRDDVAAGEFGGAYGEDDSPMPTSAAYDRGEATPVGEASFGSPESASEEDELDRRETGL